MDNNYLKFLYLKESLLVGQLYSYSEESSSFLVLEESDIPISEEVLSGKATGVYFMDFPVVPSGYYFLVVEDTENNDTPIIGDDVFWDGETVYSSGKLVRDNVSFIRKIQEADVLIEIVSGNLVMNFYEKDTSTGTPFMVKELFDVEGEPIVNIDSRIAQRITPGD